MSATYHRGTGHRYHSGQGVRDRPLVLVSKQPEVEGYVIQVNGDGRDEGRDAEATRHVDEAC